MSSVGAYEAKTHLPELIRRVESGERITITRHGHPVAELVPPGESSATDVREAIAGIKRFGDAHSLGSDMTVRQLIDDGRRY